MAESCSRGAWRSAARAVHGGVLLARCIAESCSRGAWRSPARVVHGGVLLAWCTAESCSRGARRSPARVVHGGVLLAWCMAECCVAHGESRAWRSAARVVHGGVSLAGAWRVLLAWCMSGVLLAWCMAESCSRGAWRSPACVVHGGVLLAWCMAESCSRGAMTWNLPAAGLLVSADNADMAAWLCTEGAGGLRKEVAEGLHEGCARRELEASARRWPRASTRAVHGGSWRPHVAEEPPRGCAAEVAGGLRKEVAEGLHEGCARRVSQRVAQAVQERVSHLQRTNPDMPQLQTCDLLVLDRSLDPVAPVIHDWTYEAMCYDLLPLEGDMYQRKVTTTGGEEKVKQEKLGETDSLWREYRHLHVAEAFIRVAEKAKEFTSTNKTARSMVQKSGHAASADMSTTKIKNLVESLPEYQNQLAGIARHTEIASTLQDLVTARSLNDVGKLEQDIVFGDANSKDLIKLLEAKPDLEDMDKLRVLLCYMALNPEKLDAGEIKKWEKLTRVPPELMSGDCFPRGACLPLERMRAARC
ncbi:Sec1-like domain containing protein [Cymbomonas tetramitiformis]|uniref:Sec1-like domain containing protein n=1 Tax=Cymbomonas tetramitiformis TaxID=36881 RepID=A0AAE0LB92_9CHLO|nr:Sec1-like domain containing protein [Cymbomonas tetramitiformis]